MMMPGAPGMIMRPGAAAAGAMAGTGTHAGQAEMHLEAQVADGGAPPPPASAEAPPPPDAAPARLAAGNFIGVSETNMMACVGDFNCPGTMKCCSNDMNVYVQDGHYFFRNRNPTYGYCMEPGATASMNTKSIKYTAAVES